jgi:hypothetical protein
MAKRRKSKSKGQAGSTRKTGALESIWRMVEDNPQIALAIAFEIGALISEATRSRGDVKKMLMKQLGKGAGLLPQLVSELSPKVPSALKILAGPALEAALTAYGTQNASRKVARAKRKTRV